MKVTKNLDGTLSVTETVETTRIISVDNIILQIADREKQKVRENTDRDSEIAALYAQLDEAKKLGVEPSEAVAAVAETLSERPTK